MNKRYIRLIAVILSLTMILCFVSGCGKTDINPRATITMADGAEIVVMLYPDKAPNTVANFISLANSGFYDGLTFHRVVEDFIIQGGDPNGDGTGGPGYTIEGEFLNNGYKKNDLKHTRGVISMARFGSEDNYDSAGSQFFIMLEDKDYLDGDYAAFGKVFSGMDVIEEISKVKVKTDTETPKEPVVIESIRVDTYDKNYGEPKTIKN
ncbi:MAG: peptidylprolyl isomerase [Ruminococcaceae bacterium]|nr:peptidylprolyl isomerase [Oscillospiraceae bacterium]